MPRSKADIQYDGMSKIERFCTKHLRHTKGRFANQPFELLDWEREVLNAIFGTLNPDGTRQYTKVYIEIPKKNGKTFLAAAIALYMLIVDPEPEAEVYSCAVDKDQARLCFNAAKSMIKASPALSKRVKVLRNSIEYKGSIFQPRSRDTKSAHGINPSCLILDELHVWPGVAGRDYYDALTAGDINRTQPLTIMITTAGNDQTSVCWDVHEYARQVREGIIEDESFYSYVAGVEKDDDWTDPKVWEKANPSYGVTMTEKAVRAKCNEAINNPAKQNAFRQLHLNQWVQQVDRWLNLVFWDKCDQVVPDLSGRVCYGGLDLASTTDLAAFILTFPPEDEDEPWWVLPKFWLPDDELKERSRRDQVPYTDWKRDGYLYTTPGNITDYDFIEKEVKRAAEEYSIQEIGYDPWNAQNLAAKLFAEGIETVQMRQGHATMNQPMKYLEKLVLGGKIAHGGHPVLRWNADNMVVRLDVNGNIAPDKKKARQRIDGIVALVMALGRATSGIEVEEVIVDAKDVLFFG